MKILGIGVDIIDNKRIRKSITNKAFIKRIFTSKEISNSRSQKNKTNYFAKRFAAKESFVKALGTGFRKNLNFKDVEILNNKLGKPYFLNNKKIDKIIFDRFKVKSSNFFLSISDEKDYSIAFTIIQKK
ncbi:MAG: holo-ACP synthase [Pelagibacteraceae bacterium]